MNFDFCSTENDHRLSEASKYCDEFSKKMIRKNQVEVINSKLSEIAATTPPSRWSSTTLANLALFSIYKDDLVKEGYIPIDPTILEIRMTARALINKYYEHYFS